MRLVHVVTLISDDGAYGGPLRVALNQVGELRRRGHDARLAAGWRGAGTPPREVDGVPVHAFPAHRVVPGGGFSGLYSPGLVRWLEAALPAADLAHVHTGRDLISLSALHLAARAGTPAVVQTHGMIGVDERLRAKVLDTLAVRRLLGRARRHLVLTDGEARDLPRVLRRQVALHRVRNGVSLPERGDGVDDGIDVLFCARLQQRKRPLAFVEMAALVAVSQPTARFSMVGPDEGQLPEVRDAIMDLGLADRVHYEGALPYEDVLARMASAAVYVLPSVDEPFPMSLLEAMSLGLPCICTDSCGISGLLREHGAAVITDGSAVQMATAVDQLLNDAHRREELGRRARQVVHDHFSIGAVADDLEALYTSVIDDSTR